MFIQSYPLNVPGGLPVNRGFLVRGLTNPPTPLDEVGRVDMPEIEASYRVSFSDEAQAAQAMGLKDSVQSAPADLLQQNSMLRLYQQVAGL
ncbi:MAG: hypothetical protein IPJ50_03355 [Betaproteobacteria bacterium]|jgi:hypothetical protein|nr:hypothetical protein [Betaproteobacteria bacterium]